MLTIVMFSVIIGAVLGSYLAYRDDKKEEMKKATSEPISIVLGLPSIVEKEMTYFRWLKRFFGI